MSVVPEPTEKWSLEHTVGFPPFTLQFINSNFLDHPNDLFIVGGGGGSSTTGVPNQLVVYEFKEGRIRRANHVNTGTEVAVTLALHPEKKVIACTMGDCCQLYSLSVHQDKPQLHLLERLIISDKHTLKSGTRSALFICQGKVLVTTVDDGRVSFWSCDKGNKHQLIQELTPFVHKNISQVVVDISCSPKGDMLCLSGDSGSEIWCYDKSNRSLSEGPLIRLPLINGPKDGKLVGCRFFDDSTLLFFTSKSREFTKIGKCSTDGKIIKIVTVFRYPSTVMHISADKKFVALGSSKGDVVILNIESLTTVMLVRSVHSISLTGLAFDNSSPPRYIVSTGIDGVIVVTPIVKAPIVSKSTFVAMIVALLAIVFYYILP
eukprot:TRINITY_DN3485_c0_g1_i2.p1 TRINITY_DN3485_c0_g1~~TRINITY_DN3485_c0_g1_i2.p1  ORF type:complete len:376 (+),score=58.38 TRINITY_DN3485_c0_g1_i2:409-1536(+)